jgi:hypothetical protein
MPEETFGSRAGIHHDPTPGPADSRYVYGHIWVTLAVILRHRLWGTIGLPLWAKLYVRPNFRKNKGPSTSSVRAVTQGKRNEGRTE